MNKNARKTFLKFLAGALTSTNALPVPPIQSLIADYAAFVAQVCIPKITVNFSELSGMVRTLEGLFVVDKFAICGYRVEIDVPSQNSKLIANDSVRLRSFAALDLCIDPSRSEHYYATNKFCVFRISRHRATPKLIAGSDDGQHGFADGIGRTARFTGICGCICTADGKTLYVTDSNNSRLRTIRVRTGEVKTIAGNDLAETVDGHSTAASFNWPKKLTFWRPDPNILFIASHDAICRFDTRTSLVTSLKWPNIQPDGIACTAGGIIIFGCPSTMSIYAFDPLRPDLECIGRVPKMEGFRFWNVLKVLLIDDTLECVWISYNDRLHQLTLPPHLFCESV